MTLQIHFKISISLVIFVFFCFKNFEKIQLKINNCFSLDICGYSNIDHRYLKTYRI